MTRYITPAPPFTLTEHTLNRPPERSVPMRRIATACGHFCMTAMVSTTAVLIVALVLAIAHNNKAVRTWFDWLDPQMAYVYVLPLAFYAWRWGRIKVGWHFSGYLLTDEEVYIRQGLLSRTMTVIDYGRIQTVEVSSGPYQRRFNLASVSIRTGGHSASHIEHIDPEIAAEIRDRLTEAARQRQVAL